ncbi:MAG: histidine triad nucleotide-binding protein [Gammaproteobacteria bacterium]|nr:MAG: histidine triad nucleotide-binding protein [Gammaproteobacteria bacterium]
MADCLFCKMVSGEITPDMVYEDDDVLAFRDVNPQAPVHVLVIPRQHVSTINDLDADSSVLVGKMMLAAARVAQQEGFAEQGYRTVMNCNAHGGQTVFHLHLHLLGGRVMGWPPG